MPRNWELDNIDDFISTFNTIGQGSLRRISDNSQENPDAICSLARNVQSEERNTSQETITIGLEATVAIAPTERPHISIDQQNNEIAYNPNPAIDELLERIREKSLNDYRGENMSEVWLLVSGGSFISLEDLRERLQIETTTTNFNRIFLHKGIGANLAEITFR